MFWGSCSINMALLTELSRCPIPLKTATNHIWPPRNPSNDPLPILMLNSQSPCPAFHPPSSILYPPSSPAPPRRLARLLPPAPPSPGLPTPPPPWIGSGQAEQRPPLVLRCFRWNGGCRLGDSSVRSAMSIVETIRPRNKLRQERHGKERYQRDHGQALNHQPAAPDGAWRVPGGSCSINMALLTELSRCPVPLKTATNPKLTQNNLHLSKNPFWGVRGALPGH